MRASAMVPNVHFSDGYILELPSLLEYWRGWAPSSHGAKEILGDG